MQVQSTRFTTPETLDVPEEALLVFPEGIPGFENHHAFALIEDERVPQVSWLQSLHNAQVVFVLVDPGGWMPGYQPSLEDQDLDCIQLRQTDSDVDLRCVAIVWPNDRSMTANLKAPIVLNRQRQLGKQVILTDDEYELRHPICPAAAASVA